MARNFRGITGAVRRGINSGAIKGKITYSGVRNLLPEDKKAAPDKTIRASLGQMVRKEEIQKVAKDFYTKDITKISIKAATDSNGATKMKDVCVVGKLIGTGMKDGKMIAKIAVTTLDFK